MLNKIRKWAGNRAFHFAGWLYPDAPIKKKGRK